MPDGHHRSNFTFDPWVFMTLDLAVLTRADGKLPDPKQGIGCHAYAGSSSERRRHERVIDTVHGIAQRAGRIEGLHYGVARDAFGNTYVTYYGRDRTLPAVGVGSHLDTVPEGGVYDGTAGIVFGIQLFEYLANAATPPSCSLVVIAFSSEESSPRNGVACLGSLCATGLISLEKFRAIKHEGEQLLWDRYSPDEQKQLQYDLANPWINQQRFKCYFETHIEQGPLVAAAGKQIGIVTPSIGGALREKVTSTPFERSRRVPTPQGAYYRYTIHFEGVSNHTGMTPPNASYASRNGKPMARRDALVAACAFVQRFSLKLHDSRYLKLYHEQETGFTSIPHSQYVQLLVPVAGRRQLAHELRAHQQWVARAYGVRMSYLGTPYKLRNATCVDSAIMRRYAKVPLHVSYRATEALKREGGGFGKTRATVTDFFVTPEGARWKYDSREVEHAAGEALDASIRDELQRICMDPLTIERVSQKRSQSTHEPFVARLKAIAEEQGITYHEIPSLAGHDADRVGAAGVPMAMLFYRQLNGVSHNPHEDCERADFETGNEVAKRFVLEQLYA